jgi:hypothetical protein
MPENETPKESLPEPRPNNRPAWEEDDDWPPPRSETGWIYLPDMLERRARPATDRQAYYLRKRGLWRDGMTMGEAYDLIERLKNEERRRFPPRPRRPGMP